MLPRMPLHMTEADHDAAYTDPSRWPWFASDERSATPTYRLWYLNGPEEVTCPCCARKVTLRGWEYLLLEATMRALTAEPLGNGWAVTPQRVVCIDGHGHRLCTGWAQVFRCHDGLIDLWVSEHRKDYRRGRWHPLGRVWWVTGKEDD